MFVPDHRHRKAMVCLLEQQMPDMEGISHTEYGETNRADSRLPVHRLNDDVLATIYYELVLRSGALTLDMFKWLRMVSHVSRTWRTLALDMPELWAEVVFAGQTAELFEVLLSRARDAPLVTPHPESLATKHMDFILKFPGRFRTLNIHQAQYWTTSLVGIRCSYLTDAYLMGMSQIDEYFKEGTWEAPALRSLTLRCIRICFVAPHLQSLTLSHIEANVVHMNIVNLPELQNLTLDPVPMTSWKTKFPSLVRLDLTGSVEAITQFMAMAGPFSPDLDLDIKTGASSSMSNLLLADILGPYICRLGQDTIEFRYPSKYFALFRSSPDRMYTELHPRWPGFSVSALHVVLAALLDKIPKGQIRYLHCRGFDFMSKVWATQQALFAYRLPQLVDSVDTLVFCLYAMNRSRSSPVQALPPFLLDQPTAYPQLRRLTFCFPEEYIPLTWHADLIIRLREWLETRINAGAPLDEIRLHGYRSTRSPDDTPVGDNIDIWDSIRATVKFVDERR